MPMKPSRRWVLFASMLAPLVACAPGPRGPAVAQAVATAAVDEAGLDRLLEQRMRDGRMVGLGAAIIVDGKRVWAKGYGYADLAARIPFTPDTVMNIGSIAKAFTGAAILRAVEEGELDLDEDINVYLPFEVKNPFVPDGKITLRHLSTHTSGIADRSPVYEGTYYQGIDSPESLESFLRGYFTPGGKTYSKENFLDAKPGTHREYSNIAAGLAGYIVERATGVPFNEYTKRELFVPLGMTRTGWFLSEIDLRNHSKLYENRGEAATEIPLYGLTTYPDGGVRTSVVDLSKFFIALLNGGEYEGVRVLQKSSVDEMLRFQYTAENKPANVELNEKNSGIFWATKKDVTLIGHGGTDPGLKTEMLADLSGDVGMILFTNTSLDDKALRVFFDAIVDLLKEGRKLKAEGGR